MAEDTKGTVAPGAAAGDAAPTTEPQQKYAGKFEGSEALIKGLSEIRKAHGMPERAPEVLAKMYPDPKEAEAEYVALQAALGKRAKESPKTGTILDQTKPPEPEHKPTDDAPDVPVSQVLSKAGLSEQAIYQEATANNGNISDDVVEKIRVAHPTLSQVPKASAHRLIRTEIQQQVRETQRVLTEATQVVGSQDALHVLVSERDKYVPAERRAAITRMLNDNDLFVEGVRLVKQYQDSKKQPERTVVQGDRGAPKAGPNRRTEVATALANDPTNPALLAELRKLSER